MVLKATAVWQGSRQQYLDFLDRLALLMPFIFKIAKIFQIMADLWWTAFLIAISALFLCCLLPFSCSRVAEQHGQRKFVKLYISGNRSYACRCPSPDMLLVEQAAVFLLSRVLASARGLLFHTIIIKFVLQTRLA